MENSFNLAYRRPTGIVKRCFNLSSIEAARTAMVDVLTNIRTYSPFTGPRTCTHGEAEQASTTLVPGVEIKLYGHVFWLDELHYLTGREWFVENMTGTEIPAEDQGRHAWSHGAYRTDFKLTDDI